MNLYGLGLSALNNAQVNLQTSGHNISNAGVEGYNRQSVLQQTASARATGAGYIGRGVQAVTVQRAYNSFLQNQLVQSKSQGAALVSYGNEISQLNNLFSDRTAGVSPAIQSFFDGLQAVASAPADPAARQEMLGRADSMVTQFKEANRFIDDQRDDINTQITTVVSQINSYVERIHDMNQQIVKAKAASTGGHAPNDLYDQRDQLVSELNELVGVKVYEQEGNFNLALSSGQMLLGGPTIHPLQAVPSNDDPTRYVVAHTYGYTNGEPDLAEIDDHRITGGQLSGLLQYRSDTLDPAQNALGRIAVAMSYEFNAIHKTGYDLQGQTGKEFFGVELGQPKSGANNTGTLELGISVDPLDIDINKLSAQDYELQVVEIEDAGNTEKQLQIRTLPNGSFKPLKDGDVVDGLTFNVGDLNNANVGDKWSFSPTRNAADSLKVLVDHPSDIAAAGGTTDENGNPVGLGSANGDIALELAKLQSKKTMGGGGMSFNDAYSQLVNRVAVNAQQNSTAAKAQKNLIEQNYSAQQSVSGVNLDEEYLKLDQYADQYRAASRMIEVGSILFDTLLGLRN